MYQVFFITRWFKELRFCGEFPSFEAAYSYVDYLQNKLPNGKKIVFKIDTEQAQPRAD